LITYITACRVGSVLYNKQLADNTLPTYSYSAATDSAALSYYNWFGKNLLQSAIYTTGDYASVLTCDKEL
jgi:hypothetical protein